MFQELDAEITISEIKKGIQILKMVKLVDLILC